MKKSMLIKIFIFAVTLIGIVYYSFSSRNNGDIVTGSVESVSRVTGPTWRDEGLPNPNDTHENYGVRATDLGVIWDATTDENDEKVMIAFGDTYDDGWYGFGGGGVHSGWRSNVLAISRDQNLADGLEIDEMITDPDYPNYAIEIIHSEKETNGYGDFTAIPTAGITVGNRHYIHYMQIRNWGEPGEWQTNFSEIAYSDDEGQTWTKSGVTWDGDSNFAMTAFTNHDGYVYMFGTPSGRYGDLYLSRVSESDMLERDSYEYWDGTNWVSGDESAAAPIVDAPISELSVQYNEHFNKWIMMYLNEDKYSVVMRTSSNLTEGWSDEDVVVTGEEYPQLYGTFIHPWTNDGTDLYFVMTMWEPYNVILLRAELETGDISN